MYKFFVPVPFISLAKAHSVISWFVHGRSTMKALPLPIPQAELKPTVFTHKTSSLQATQTLHVT